jgi:hypothetical protein
MSSSSGYMITKSNDLYHDQASGWNICKYGEAETKHGWHSNKGYDEQLEPK